MERILEATLAALGGARPRGMTALVDLLRRLAQDTDARVADPAAREALR